MIPPTVGQSPPPLQLAIKNISSNRHARPGTYLPSHSVKLIMNTPISMTLSALGKKAQRTWAECLVQYAHSPLESMQQPRKAGLVTLELQQKQPGPREVKSPSQKDTFSRCQSRDLNAGTLTSEPWLFPPHHLAVPRGSQRARHGNSRVEKPQ